MQCHLRRQGRRSHEAAPQLRRQGVAVLRGHPRRPGRRHRRHAVHQRGRRKDCLRANQREGPIRLHLVSALHYETPNPGRVRRDPGAALPRDGRAPGQDEAARPEDHARTGQGSRGHRAAVPQAEGEDGALLVQTAAAEVPMSQEDTQVHGSQEAQQPRLRGEAKIAAEAPKGRASRGSGVVPLREKKGRRGNISPKISDTPKRQRT